MSYWSYSFSIINFLSLQDIQQMSLFLMATSPQISPILQEIIKIQCKKTCLVVFSILSKLPKSVNYTHHTHLLTSHSFCSPVQSDITLYRPLKLFSLRGPEISNEQIQGIFFQYLCCQSLLLNLILSTPGFCSNIKSVRKHVLIC